MLFGNENFISSTKVLRQNILTLPRSRGSMTSQVSKVASDTGSMSLITNSIFFILFYIFYLRHKNYFKSAFHLHCQKLHSLDNGMEQRFYLVDIVFVRNLCLFPCYVEEFRCIREALHDVANSSWNWKDLFLLLLANNSSSEDGLKSTKN